MRDWLWHLFNDSMRTNAWSIVALVVIVVMTITGAILIDTGVRRVRFLGKREPETMDDKAQAAETISAARAGTEDDGWSVPRPRPETLADYPAGKTVIETPPASLHDEPAMPGPRMSVPPADSGVHALPEPTPARVMQVACDHCGGTGYVEMTVNDLLRESIALIPDGGGDMVVKEFYTNLLHAAPNLAEIFPPDLLTTDETKHQRDKLYQALAALATLYDPQDDEKMARLRTAAGSFGRSHASFYRPSEGISRGASLAEYVAVEAILLDTFHAVAGAEWKPEYDAAWAVAYEHLTAMMLDAQHSTPMTAPRFPRS